MLRICSLRSPPGTVRRMALDLDPADLAFVRAVLRRYLPGRRVRAFGSRVAGTAKRFSDLDLAIMGDRPVPDATIAALAEAFDDSALPFKVDLLDWARTGAEFRAIVAAESEALETGTTGATSG